MWREQLVYVCPWLTRAKYAALTYCKHVRGTTSFDLGRSAHWCCLGLFLCPRFRSNLPDNLKQLFRAVAMVVPDRKLIAQVRTIISKSGTVVVREGKCL